MGYSILMLARDAIAPTLPLCLRSLRTIIQPAKHRHTYQWHCSICCSTPMLARRSGGEKSCLSFHRFFCEVSTALINADRWAVLHAKPWHHFTSHESNSDLLRISIKSPGEPWEKIRPVTSKGRCSEAPPAAHHSFFWSLRSLPCFFFPFPYSPHFSNNVWVK